MNLLLCYPFSSLGKSKGPDYLWPLLFVFISSLAHAGQVSLPGSDPTDSMASFGSLLRILDTSLFRWGSRILAGISLLSAGWAIREQRIAVFFLCLTSCFIFAFLPGIVKEAFDAGGGETLFSLFYSGVINYV